MINTQPKQIPSYTTRDFVNTRPHKANSMYVYKFTPRDHGLLLTGAVKLFPVDMCEFKVTKKSILKSKEYEGGEEIDAKELDPKTLYVLMKDGTISCRLKDYKDQDVIKLARLHEFVGKNFKEFCSFYELDEKLIKDKFKIKQMVKKITIEDIESLRETITQEV